MRPEPAKRTVGLDHPTMRTFQDVLGRQGVMSFGAGFMNPDGFDVAGLRMAFAGALSAGEAASALQYGLAEGSERLRGAIVRRMSEIGVPAEPREIVVTSGATQALDVLCNALLDPGDAVLVERPTYATSLQRLRLAQARIISIPGDEDGLDPVALEAAVIEHRPKVIYTIPTFQNPGGATMSRERRIDLARIGERHQVWVIEDDPYRELRYGAEPPEPIACWSRDRVIYIGTLAKTVAPGLRVGWVCAAREVVELCKPVKQAMDLNTSTIDQAAAAIYLERVDWRQRTSELRAVYSEPMRAMLDLLPAVMPNGSRWSNPQGGVFVWVELPDGWSSEALLEVALEHGIFYMPGQLFFADLRSENTLRLSISNHSPATIAAGLPRLGAALSAFSSRMPIVTT